jgi:hypothetical protein
MADPSLTDPSLDPAARRVIGTYLAELAERLGSPSPARAAILAELEDGLWTTATAAHQAQSMSPAEAARAAVAEFGDVGTVAAGFGPELAAATGRRVGLALLATGRWSAAAAGRPPGGGDDGRDRGQRLCRRRSGSAHGDAGRDGACGRDGLAGCPSGRRGEFGAAQLGRPGGTPLPGRPRDPDLTGSSRRRARARRIKGTPTRLGSSQ